VTVIDQPELFIPDPLPKGSGTRFIPCDGFNLRDDGRSLEGCIVPYGQVATVVEPDETGKLVKYQEQFLRGSLAGMSQGFKARGLLDLPLFLGHEETMENRIGYATGLEDREDGAWAAFRIYDNSNLVKIQSMLRESHTGLSVKFRDVRAPRQLDGVISRVQVFVRHVAATPVPTYAGAGITAIRSQDEAQEAPRPSLEAVRAWLTQERQNGAQDGT
jgi:HK97 family phage prohead protease